MATAPSKSVDSESESVTRASWALTKIRAIGARDILQDENMFFTVKIRSKVLDSGVLLLAGQVGTRSSASGRECVVDFFWTSIETDTVFSVIDLLVAKEEDGGAFKFQSEGIAVSIGVGCASSHEMRACVVAPCACVGQGGVSFVVCHIGDGGSVERLQPRTRLVERMLDLPRWPQLHGLGDIVQAEQRWSDVPDS